MSDIGITSPVGRMINDRINTATGLSDDGVSQNNYSSTVVDGLSSNGGDAEVHSIGKSVLDSTFEIDGEQYEIVPTFSGAQTGFFGSRVPKTKLSLGTIFEYFREKWSVRKLDNTTQMFAQFKKAGLTPVVGESTVDCVLGKNLGQSNLDEIAKIDQNFTATKEVWNKVRAVEVGTAGKLSESKGTVRERCPITGDVLTPKNAVLVDFKADTHNKAEKVLVSRQGIKNALLRTDNYNSTVNRARLMDASFDKVTEESFVPTNPVARALRMFFGGDIQDLSYNYKQSGDYKKPW